MKATEVRNLSLDSEFLAQLSVTLCIVGQDVVAESAATTNHAERLAFALKVFAEPEAWARKLAFAIGTVQSIRDGAVGAIPDATLRTIVTAAWNVLRQVV